MDILTRLDWWAALAFLGGMFLAALYYQSEMEKLKARIYYQPEAGRLQQAVRNIVDDRRKKTLISLLLYRAVRRGNDNAWGDFKLLEDMITASFSLFPPEEREPIAREYREAVVEAVGTVPENLEAVRQLVARSKPV